MSIRATMKLYPSNYVTKNGNPRRPGSHGYNSLEIIIRKPGVSYDEFIKAGGRAQDLRWDIDKNYVSVKGKQAPVKKTSSRNAAAVMAIVNSQPNEAMRGAMNALQLLGYSEQDAKLMVAAACAKLPEDATSRDILGRALRKPANLSSLRDAAGAIADVNQGDQGGDDQGEGEEGGSNHEPHQEEQHHHA
jgi:hypothetical protein